MKVLFRVDASKNIGTGHVMRCLTLANVLRNHGCKIEFACIQRQGDLILFIQQQGYRVAIIPYKQNGLDNNLTPESIYQNDIQKKDSHCFINKLSVSNKDIVVVDHYGLDHHWASEIKKTACRILVIDDLANRQHICDFLLDQNLHENPSSRYKNKVDLNCNLFLGPKYALLRPEFYSERPLLKQVNKRIPHFLVYLGFVDPKDTTSKIIAAIESLEFEVKVDFVLSELHPNFRELKSKALELENIDIHLQPADILSILKRVDFVIGAGGSATWERCCLGIPSILFALTENQKVLAEELSKLNTVLYLKEKDVVSVDKIKQAIIAMVKSEAKRLSFSERSQALVDGVGAERVAAIMMNSLAKDNKPVFLKKLKSTDANMIFEWQHEPDMRKHCRIDAPPEKKEHELWIKSRVNCQNSVTNIIYHDEQAVGMVRLDKLVNIDALEVSILLTTQSRGLGIAKIALNLLLAKYKKNPIRAYINVDNITSQYLFSNLNFVPLDNKNWWILKSPPRKY
ncbi:UDP-2,4-diacetamido-2,4,6-trideoxy-beta-L-altropyranose hydrolase [Pseudoalteromonas denitrificans]|uniref:UDP-2,4-diacetamido-2,4,6-trideoxy-beta-L-altropyranose hydrolase n=1 Tax=Pseudoalteromonas denitrificans DSM 6059 TaxID=1123010 RepID=A0A1I1HKR3_9GAMM|nr:UDP-2,4-diacetamido-2,4,6-trideoxy-beta-L-altropyranose hydrolase [Pseudoalteromonas denitrificans]SFC24441.1 UDP-2,4-diacetamido-2,4,6-trideoxy-beta-L-altropyranose hydrolase [Pseudoalteromonas denitrificans DSM 6059]